MDSVLDWVCEYSKKSKLCDKELIKKIYDYICESLELDEYVKKIIFRHIRTCKEVKDNQYRTMMGYDQFRKIIIVDEKTINGFIKGSKDFIDKHLVFEDNYSIYLTMNLLIIFILLHEFEHSNQIKKEMSDNQDFESILLRIVSNYHYYFHSLSKLDFFMLDNFPFLKKDLWILYKKYIDFHNKTAWLNLNNSPEERLANYYAFLQIKDMLDKVGIENITNYFGYYYYELMLHGYQFNANSPKKTISSTQVYLDKLKEYNIPGLNELYTDTFLKRKEEVMSSSFEERIKYGLDINLQEYFDLISQREEYKRKLTGGF